MHKTNSTKNHLLTRLREVEFVEPIVLPIDPDASWGDGTAHVAYPEPPPWAISVAQERGTILVRSHA